LSFVIPFEDSRGVGYELGKLFAQDFNFAYKPIIFEKNADVLAAAKQGRVDMIFTNVSLDRADDFAFSKPILKLEKGYLIGSQRGIKNIADIDVPTRKIGVSEGSSSQNEITKLIKYAQIVTTTSTTSAMLKAGQIDVFSVIRPFCMKCRIQFLDQEFWEMSLVMNLCQSEYLRSVLVRFLKLMIGLIEQ